VIAENIDRISRLRLSVAEALVDRMRAAGARVSIPGLVNLSELVAGSNGSAKIVLETVQELLLRLMLQMARDDYEIRRKRQQQSNELSKQPGKYRGREPNLARQKTIIALRTANHSIR
jgi:DNA invertase Pin-like site-specific DNA recombinase